MKSLPNYIKDIKSSLIPLSEKLIICPSQMNEKLVINKNYKDINNIENFLSSEKLVYIKFAKITSTTFPKVIIDIKKIKQVNDYNINDTEITMSYGDGILFADTFNNCTFSLQKNNLSLLSYNNGKRRNNLLSSITLLINPSVNDKVKSMITTIHNIGNYEKESKDALIDFIKYVVDDDNDQNTIIDFIGEKLNTNVIIDKYCYDRLMSEL